MCFVSVWCYLDEFVNHSGCRGNTAQALAQWRHPVAPSETLDMLYQVMRNQNHQQFTCLF
jgi:hypothetical protein